MKYNSLRISIFEIIRYVVKMYLEKTFGSSRERWIDPETGTELPKGQGVPEVSVRDSASMLWAYMWVSDDLEKKGFQLTFVLDRIWENKAPNDLLEARACFEDAQTYMLNNM